VTPTKKTKIAHKYHSPGDDRSMDSNVCNHPLLNCRCSEYKDHRGEKVEKRCIFTLCGSDINPSGISMILAANLLEGKLDILMYRSWGEETYWTQIRS